MTLDTSKFLLYILHIATLSIVLLWLLTDFFKCPIEFWIFNNERNKSLEPLAVILIVLTAFVDFKISNKEIDKRFDDLEFQRLKDNHYNSLRDSVLEFEGKEYRGLLALKQITEKIKEELKNDEITLKNFLIDTPANKLIDNDRFIFEVLLEDENLFPNASFEINKKEFIEEMKKDDFFLKSEYLKRYLDKSCLAKNKISTIASRNFFKYEYKLRMSSYERAFDTINRDYSTTFSLHLKHMIEATNFIENNKKYYFQYISLLSIEEKLLVFYFIMKDISKPKNIITLYKSDFFNMDELMDSMIDGGDRKVIGSDLETKYNTFQIEINKIKSKKVIVWEKNINISKDDKYKILIATIASGCIGLLYILFSELL